MQKAAVPEAGWEERTISQKKPKRSFDELLDFHSHYNGDH